VVFEKDADKLVHVTHLAKNYKVIICKGPHISRRRRITLRYVNRVWPNASIRLKRKKKTGRKRLLEEQYPEKPSQGVFRTQDY
jgi:hypothetical protein